MYEIKKALFSDKKKKLILDTDTYNEIDDQFAVAYAMLSTDKIDLLSINAAPFLNNRSISPEDGMEKSYDEIKRIIKLTDSNRKIPVFKGSKRFLADKKTPVVSPAAENIIKTAMESDEKIYVAAIGAITNVASAILMQPEIINKIIVVWLGGNSHQSPNTHEFNMYQDIKASQIIFDSGVPLVQIPCDGVCSALTTTIPEIEYYLKGKNELCDYLVDIIKGYTNDPFCWSKVIWDISAISCIIIPKSMEHVVIPTPIITDDGYYASDNARNPMIYVRKLNRDAIYKDVFTRLINK